jgi:hypothetical protein
MHVDSLVNSNRLTIRSLWLRFLQATVPKTRLLRGAAPLVAQGTISTAQGL